MSANINAGKLNWIFWKNIYGSPFVDKWGRDFLLGAPGISYDDQGNGAVTYLTKESPAEDYSAKMIKEISRYFAQKTSVKIYRAASFRIDWIGGPCGFGDKRIRNQHLRFRRSTNMARVIA